MAVDDSGEGNATSEPATVTITVTGTNDKPTAEVASVSATEDGAAVTGNFSATDADTTDTHTFNIVTQPSEGTVTNNDDGTFSFNPGSDFQDLAAGETRQVTFTYVAVDDSGEGNATSEPATVTITITGTNDKPTAEVESVSATEDGAAVTGNFGATDADTTDTHTFNIVTQPTEGTVTNNDDGTFSFNPGGDFQDLAAGETRQVTFTYVAVDDSGEGNVTSEPATVTITITGTNDKPTAEVVSVSATEDGAAVTGNFGATDADTTDTHTFNIVTQPIDGTVTNNDDGTFSFNPGSDFQDLAAGETRQVTFTYVAVDDSGEGNATSEPATVTITITGTNDKPTAEVVSVSATEDGAAVTGNFNATDADTTDTHTFNIVTQPSEGTVTNNDDGTFSFNPGSDFQDLAAGETRQVTFTYVAVDDSGEGNATSEPATVTITITGTNDKPTAEVVSVSATEDGAAVTGNFGATDADTTDTHTFNIVTQPSEGTVTNNDDGTFSFNPGSDFQDLAAGETRQVTFTYVAIDDSGEGNATSEPATVTITITGTNDKPTAAVESVSATEDGAAVTGNFGATDADTTDTHTFNIVTQPSEGTVTNNNDGTFSFNPGSDFQDLAAGETRQVTFTYVAMDDSGEGSATSEPATVTITITGTNDKPTAAVESVSATEDGAAVTGNFGATDADTTDTHTFNIVTQPSEGTVTNNDDGTFSFNPGSDFQDLAAGETRQVTFTYVAVDDSGEGNATSEPATVTITITGTNDKPTAAVESVSATEDGAAVTGNFGATDADTTDTHTFNILTQPTEGTVTNNDDGTFSFNPGSDFQDLAAGETRQVTFTYVAIDDSGEGNATSEPATVTITITGTNDKPTAEVVSVSATEDGAVVTGNFGATDADTTDTHTFNILTQPTEGTVTNNDDGTFSFNPGSDFQDLAAGETRQVTFTYVAVDDSGEGSATSEPATVTITITGTNDKPTAAVESVSATEDGAAVTGNFGATDADTTDTHTFNIVTQPSEGTVTNNDDGTFSFNPGSDFQDLAAGETRQVTFTYVAVDDSGEGNATSEPATVTITITGTNDKPTAEVVSVSATEDGAAVTGNFSATDADTTDTHTFNIVTQPSEGTVTNNNDGTFSFNPGSDFQDLAAGETRQVTFTYVAVDDSGEGNATSEPATVTITITGTNDKPTAEVVSVSATEDGAAVTGNFNATDADTTDTHTFNIVTQPTEGTVTNNDDGTFSFNPGSDFQDLAAGETRQVTFTYVAVDDSGEGNATSEPATITITVTGTNDAPIAVADTGNASIVGTTTLDVLANDTDVDSDDTAANFSLDAVTITGITDSDGSRTTNGGSVQIVNNRLEFNPAGDFDYLAIGESATVTVSYTMSDDEGVTSTATATITISGSNAQPVAELVSVNTAVEDGGAVSGSFSATDANLSDTHTFNILTQPTEGTVTNNDDGTFSFNPGSDFQDLAAGETRQVTFTYEAVDSSGQDNAISAAATVTVTVTGTNDQPVAEVVSVSATEDGAAVTGNFSATDEDTTDTHTFNILTQPAEGTVINNNDGTFSFNPGSDFQDLAVGETRQVTFTYAAVDDSGTANNTSEPATVTITVTGTNDGPVAVADSDSTLATGSVTVDVIANDTDVDNGDVLSLQAGSASVGSALFSNMAITLIDAQLTQSGNSITFDPGSDFDFLDAGETATVTINYTVEDDQGASSPGTLTVTVTGTNDGPQAVADTGTTTENAALQLDVLSNDTDVDQGDSATNFTLQTVELVDEHGDPVTGQGSVSIVNNRLNYNPGNDFDTLATGETATVIVRYTMADSSGEQSSSTATITVTGTNDDPVATADDASGHENEVLTIDVLANDTDVDNDDNPANFSLDNVQVVDGDGNPVNNQGSVSIVNNELRFDPGTDFDYLATGETTTVTLRYVMSDDEGATSASDVTVTITGTNDAPVAKADFPISESGFIPALSSANDQGYKVTASGQLSDAFAAYKVFDNVDASSVNNTNAWATSGSSAWLQLEMPESKSILQYSMKAIAQSVGREPSEWEFLGSNDGVNFVVLDSQTGINDWSSRETKKFTLDAPADYRFFRINITDNNGEAYTGFDEFQLYEGSSANATGEENETLTIDVLANDIDADHNDNTANFTLQTVQVVDGNGDPVSGQGSVSVHNNQLQFVPGSDFDYLAVGESTTVTVRYVMSDNEGATSESTVTLQIQGTNDQPVVAPVSVNASDSSSINGNFSVTDTDTNDSHSFTILTQPAEGTVTNNNDGSFTFNPGTDFRDLAEGQTRQVTFTYTATDASGADNATSTAQTVTITVTGTNDAPVAVVDTRTIDENSQVTVDVIANDTDVDNGDVISLRANSVSISTAVSEGNNAMTLSDASVSQSGNNVTFNPGTDFDFLGTGETATVTISYQVQDQSGATDEGTLTVTVTGSNDGPVAAVDTGSTTENAGLTLDVLANDTDADHNDSAANFSLDSVEIIDGDGNPLTGKGYVSIVNNLLHYNPDSDFDRLATGETDTITVRYVMSDDEGETSESTATITVTGTNDDPVATADTAAGHENQVLTIDVLSNDSDSDHNDDVSNFSLDTVQLVDTNGDPVTGQGSVSIVGNQLQFDPGADFDYLATGESATVTVRYNMSDDEGADASSTVTITITGTNDTPEARADYSVSETGYIPALTSNNDQGFKITSSHEASAAFAAYKVFDDVAASASGNANSWAAQGSSAWLQVEMPEAKSILQYSLTAILNNVGREPSEWQLLGSNDGVNFEVIDTQSSVTDWTSRETKTFSLPSAVEYRFFKLDISDNNGDSYTGLDGFQLFEGTTHSVVGDEHEVLTVNVLANDLDADHNDSAANFTLDNVQIVDENNQPVSGLGNASIVGNQLRFDPGNDFDYLAAGESASITVRYTMSDDEGASSTSTVTLVINGTNDKPTAEVVSVNATEDGAAITGHFSATDTDTSDTHSFNILNQPAEGTVTNNGDGTFSFNPGSDFQDLAAGETRQVTFTYEAVDSSGTANATSEPATVTITVTGTNDKPTAAVESVSATEDGAAVTGNFGATDADTTDTHTFNILTQPTEGSVTNNGDGTFSFNPGSDFQDLAAGETRQVTFTYEAVDDSGSANDTSEPSTVTITITGTNDKPTAAVESVSATEDGVAVTGNFGATDADTTDTHTFNILTQPTEGSVTNNDDGTFSFNPGSDFQDLAAGETRQVTFTYVAVDDSGTANNTSEPATVTITITGTNDKPTAAVESVSATEDGAAVTGNFGATDADTTDTHTFNILTQPTEGTVTNNNDGTFSFNPGSDFQDLAAGETRQVTFTYEAVDDSGTANDTSEPATVTITITGTNDAPVAVVDSDTTSVGSTLLMDVLANDTDVDSDDNSSNFSLDNVNITGITDSDGSRTINGGTVSIENNQLKFVPGSDFDYLAVGESATVTVSYTMSDDSGETSTATATITVSGTNSTPVAQAVNVGATEDGAAVSGNFAVTDDNTNDTHSFNILTQPDEGTVTNNGDGTFSFNPGSDFQDLAAGETRQVTFTYEAVDSSGTANATSEPATVTITVTGTNDKPAAAVESVSATEDGVAVTGNFGATDADTTDTHTFNILTQPTEGSVTNNDDGTFSFNPGSDFQDLAAGETRQVTFTYEAVDDSGEGNATSEPATVTITITGTNDKPTAAVESVSATEDGVAVTGNFGATDADTTDTHTFNILTQPTEGSVTNNDDGTFSFNPGSDFQDLAAGETRQVTFTYVAVDDSGTANNTSEPATVTITITGTNDKPTAVVESVSATEDGAAVTGNFGATDADTTDTHTFNILTQPTEGSVTNNGDGTFSFNPGSDFQDLAAGETRQVTFTYEAVDDSGEGNATSEPATVTITITGTNDKPTAAVESVSATEDGVAVTGNFGATDADTTDTHTFNILTQPTEGSVTNNDDGTFSFNPGSDFQDLAAGETRQVTFTYVAVDDSGTANNTSEPATVTITITGTNDKPTAAVESVSATEDGAAVTGNFGATDADTTDTHTFNILTQPTEGTVTNNNDGTFSFNPGSDFQDLAAGETRQVTFTYEAVDDSGTANDTSEPATVTITITGTNDAPVAAVDTKSTAANTTLTVDVLANDTDVDSNDTSANFSLDNVSITGITDSAGTRTTGGGTVSVVGNQLQFNPGSDFSYLAAGESATVTVTYTMSDDEGLESTSTATITVNGVNEAPTASDKTLSIDEDNSHTFTSNDFGFSDVDTSDSLQSIKITQLPSAGSLTFNGATVTANQVIAAADIPNLVFTPVADANGAGYADFQFTVSDGSLESAAQTITFDVAAVNDAPTITPSSQIPITETTLEFSSSSLPEGVTTTNLNWDQTDQDHIFRPMSSADSSIHFSTPTHLKEFDINGLHTSSGSHTTGSVTLRAFNGSTEIWSQSVDLTDHSDWNNWLTVSVDIGNVTELRIDAGSFISIDNVVTLTDGFGFTIDENSSHTFSESDFGFTDKDGDSLHSVKITELPAAGSLTLNGAAVTANQVITAADIPNLVFTPDENTDGSNYASITYTVSDGSLESAPATMGFNVSNVNSAPVAADSAVTLDEDDSHTFSVSDFGFTDREGDALHSVRITQLPAAGSLTLGGTAVIANQVIAAADIPNLVFTPAANANGAGYASFEFTVSDGSLESTAETMTLNVTAVNDAPTTADHAVTLDEDGSHTFSASEFDFADIDGDALHSIKITQLPAAGSLTLNGTAVTASQVIAAADIPNLIFTPAADANGAGYASFEFTVSDGTEESTAETMTLNVTAVNDAPVPVPPTTTLTFDDVNNPGVTLSDDMVAHTTGGGHLYANFFNSDDSITFPTPTHVKGFDLNGMPWENYVDSQNRDSHPTDEFTIKAFSGSTEVWSTTVDLTDYMTWDNWLHVNVDVENVTELRFIAPGEALWPALDNLEISRFSVTADEDGSHTFEASDFGFADVDGDALHSVTITQVPAAGTLTLNGVAVTANQAIAAADIPNLVFTPAANANGVGYSSLQFTVSDGLLDSTVQTMNIDVNRVNDAPTASDNTVTLDEDSSHTFAASEFGFSDIDAGDTLQSIKITQLPSAGTLMLSGVAVTANQVINADDIPNLVFTPVADANGAGYADLKFTVSDGSLESTEQTITFDVTAGNDAPTASDNTVTLDEDGSHTFAATEFGFSDIDAGDSLQSVKITQLPAAGSLTLNGTAVTANQVVTAADITNLVFTPAANANGAGYADLQFTVTDSGGLESAAQTITFNVDAVNDAPEAVTVINFDDSNIPGVTFSEHLVSSSTGGGHVYANMDGSDDSIYFTTPTHVQGFDLNGMPWENYVNSQGKTAQTHEFTIKAFNGTTEVWSTTVNLEDYMEWDNWLHVDVDVDNVTELRFEAPGANTNLWPSIDNLAIVRGVVLEEDGSHTFTSNDFGFSDIDGDALDSVIITQLPASGSLTLNGTAVTANQSVAAADIANLVYTPPANANGVDYVNLQYKVSDGSLESSVQTLNIDVSAVNDAPTASDNTVTLDEDDSHTFSATEFGFNDIDAGDTLHSIKITQLPSTGSLTFNGTAVTANQVIAAADIPNLVFTPVADANGTGYADFQFTVSDGSLESAVQTITLDVTAVNDAPVPVPPTTTLTFDDTNNPGVTLGGDMKTATTGGGHLFAETFSSDDSITFPTPTHVKGFDLNGLPWENYVDSQGRSHTTDEFTIKAFSGSTEVWSTTVDLTDYMSWDNWLHVNVDVENVTELRFIAPGEGLWPSIDNLEISRFSVSADEDGSHTFAASDFGFADVDGDALHSVTITQVPSQGSLTLNGVAVTANQAIAAADITNLVFTPAANANGVGYSSLQFTVSDGSLNSAVQTMNIDVNTVNDAPTAVDNTVTLDEDSSHTFAASEFGFSDIDNGDTLQSVKITQLPAAGSLTLNGTAVTANQAIEADDIPNLVFTPAANANGVGYADFKFTVSDGSQESAEQTLTFNVTSINDAPDLQDESATANHLSTATGNVLANDSDIEGDALTVTTINGQAVAASGSTDITGEFGTLSIAADGTWSYTLDSTYASADLHTGLVAEWNFDESSGSSAADSAPDDAEATNGVLTGDAAFVSGGLKGNAVSLDGDGDMVTVGDSTEINTYSGSIDERTISFSFKVDPDNDLSGTQILYEEGGTSNGFSIYIHEGQLYVGAWSESTSWSGTFLNTSLDASDNDWHHVSLVLDGDAGSLKGYLDGSVFASGSGEGVYQHGDEAAFGGVNVTTQIHTGDLTTGTHNFHGQIDEARIYNRALTDNEVKLLGADSFNYEVSDGTDTSTATLNINIAANTAPTASDNTLSLDEDSTHTFAASEFGFADSDSGDSMASIKITQLPGAGSLTLNGTAVTANQVIAAADIPNLVFTPAANANGAGYASFQFTVTDSGGMESAAQTITLNVDAVNDAPVLDSSLDPAVNPESRVNSAVTTGEQKEAHSDSTANGAITVWHSEESSSHVIRAKLPDGTEIQVNDTEPTGNQDVRSPEVAVLDNGNFAVTWQLFTPGVQTQSRMRVFDADGTEIKSEFDIATNNYSEKLIALSDNKFAFVSFEHDANFSVHVRLFDANGNETNDIAVGNLGGWGNGGQDIVALDNGGFAVTWRDTDSGSDSASFRIYDASGNSVAGPISYGSAAPTDNKNVDIEVLDSGELLTAYQSGDDLYFQRWTSSGTASGSPVRINTTTDGSQVDVTLEPLADGSFFAVWRSEGQDGDGQGIYGRHFDATGNPLTDEILINTTTTGNQHDPEVTQLPSGEVLITWTSDHGGDSDVYNTTLDLSGNRVSEGASNGTVVGKAVATEIDTSDTLTYSLVNDAGNRFAIDSNTGTITVGKQFSAGL